ncbi:MAG: hypothetical protein QM639_03310 [Rhodocyclaceae bacterium]|jgi:hypothetical protein
MKRTDLEKNRGLKINGKLKQASAVDRFGAASGDTPDRREQRKLDQARGLIPFAVKLDGALVGEIRELAQSRNTDINELVTELLRKGLSA